MYDIATLPITWYQLLPGTPYARDGSTTPSSQGGVPEKFIIFPIYPRRFFL